jgi:hypothetical protein
MNEYSGVTSMILDRAFLRSFSATVDWLYSDLMRNAGPSSGSDIEHGLGGKLLYAGELDPAGCALVVAANIAGAATLAATADVDAQELAVRDGIVDFVVTTLPEALHILMNEIRKRETVAVCVAQSPEDVEREMVAIGVLPDLLPPGAVDALRFEPFLRLGARQVDPVSADENLTVLTWKVENAPALWLPKLDAIADDCLGSFPGSTTEAARRWLERSPRFLGRLAQSSRLLRCETEVARAFLNKVREAVASRQLDVQVEICLTGGGESHVHELSPPADDGAGDDLTLANDQRIQSWPTIH